VTAYRLTIAARRNLGEILDYSLDRWGERRAETYLRDIHGALNALCRGESNVQPCEHFGAGLSFIRSGSHNIYLRYDAKLDLYLVIGVLHQSMDPPRHLTAPDDGE